MDPGALGWNGNAEDVAVRLGLGQYGGLGLSLLRPRHEPVDLGRLEDHGPLEGRTRRTARIRGPPTVFLESDLERELADPDLVAFADALSTNLIVVQKRSVGTALILNVDSVALSFQDGMLSGDSRVVQEDVGAWVASDRDQGFRESELSDRPALECDPYLDDALRHLVPLQVFGDSSAGPNHNLRVRSLAGGSPGAQAELRPCGVSLDAERKTWNPPGTRRCPVNLIHPVLRRRRRSSATFALICLLLPATSTARETAAERPDPTLHLQRPVSTYSIVARDPDTGQLGVAVQSHWFSVGPIVPWAEAGVGAVATQSFVDPSYGPMGIELMRSGRSAQQALQALVSSDPDSSVRQVAMVDANGNVAAHTGSLCIHEAGNRTGAQFSVQANLMDGDGVWPAMAKAFSESGGDLAERLLAALEAAEKEGGDIRGRQSAAILIVSPVNTGRPWADRLFDLRVEDDPNPVGELRRLVQLQRVYLKMNEGDEWVTKGDLGRALSAYEQACDMVPDEATNGEAAFWVGVTLADNGRVDEAIPYLQRAQAQDPNWARLVPRLPASKLLPDDRRLIERLVKEMQP